MDSHGHQNHRKRKIRNKRARFINMKKLCIALFPVLTGFVYSHANPNISFIGSNRKVITVTPPKNSGLDAVYVAYDCTAISAISIDGASSDVRVQKYSNLGGGHAVNVPVSFQGGNAIISSPEGNMGYIIESNGRPTYIWLVNYRDFEFKITSVTPAAEQTCYQTDIEMAGSGPAIHYYSIDGRQMELSHEIEMDYISMEWDEASETYSNKPMVKVLDHYTDIVSITPPVYASTFFTVSGDRYLKEWGMERKCESNVLPPNGVAITTSGIQAGDDSESDSDVSNMIKTEGTGLGGSAPCDMEFRAYGTEGIDHYEWQIAADLDFEYLQYQFYTQDMDYRFLDEGVYYVRCVGTNTSTHCQAIGETYTISIGASELKIPNAFTPNDDGINDEWKVSYRSLLDFRCWIFDRYGNEIFQFTDPSKGWDGKYKGKLVNPGVYFYVIEATGADGKKYKKGGDINILRSKQSLTPGGPAITE